MERVPSSTGRYNINEHFEEVYLAEKWLSKLIAKADPEILNNKDFRNTITFMSKKHWNKTGRSFLFRSNGFDSQDVYNMTLLFGFAFFGTDFKGKTIKDSMNVMMNFIDQRFAKVVDVIYRKFQLNEVIRSNHELLINDEEELFADEEISNDIDEELEDNSDETFYSSSISDQDEDELEDDLINILDDRESFDPYHASDLEFATENKIQKNRVYIQEKLSLIASNPDKYAKELSRYAVSKHVSGDVRKIAKKICEKYEINYAQWAQQQITQGAGQNEFDLYEKVH